MSNLPKEITKLNICGFFEFRGVNHPVYSDGERDYFFVKSLVEQIDLSWHGQRAKLLDGDNLVLFGTANAVFGSASCSKTAQTDGNEPKNSQNNCVDSDVLKAKEGIYIRLDRVQTYLHRLSTNQIRKRGNSNAADYILELQQEWADALHQYETKGVATKSTESKLSMERGKTLNLWLDMQKKATDESVKEYINKEIQLLTKKAS